MADSGRRRVRHVRGYVLPATVDSEAEPVNLRVVAAKLDGLRDIDEADIDEMVQEFEKLRKPGGQGGLQ